MEQTRGINIQAYVPVTKLATVIKYLKDKGLLTNRKYSAVFNTILNGALNSIEEAGGTAFNDISEAITYLELEGFDVRQVKNIRVNDKDFKVPLNITNFVASQDIDFDKAVAQLDKVDPKNF